MEPMRALRLLTVASLVVLAGCFGTVGGSDDAPRPPTGTPVQGTTPTGDWDPNDSVPIQRFSSGPSVCEPAPTTSPAFTLTTNGTAGVVTVTVTGAIATDDVARFVPPGGLMADVPGRYTLWVSTRADVDRTPSACDGHVPYEAVFDLPHDGTDPFTVTVMHDGEVVGTYESVAR